MSTKSPFSPWQGGEGGRRPDEGAGFGGDVAEQKNHTPHPSPLP